MTASMPLHTSHEVSSNELPNELAHKLHGAEAVDSIDAADTIGAELLLVDSSASRSDGRSDSRAKSRGNPRGKRSRRGRSVVDDPTVRDDDPAVCDADSSDATSVVADPEGAVSVGNSDNSGSSVKEDNESATNDSKFGQWLYRPARKVC